MKKTPGKQSRPRPTELLVVLVDSAGNFYELSRETLESCRVDEDRKDEIKDAIADALSASGYINNAVIPGSIVANFMVPVEGLKFAGAYRREREEADAEEAESRSAVAGGRSARGGAKGRGGGKAGR